MTGNITINLDGHDMNLSCTWREGGDDLLLFIHGLGCDRTGFDGAHSSPLLKGYSLLIPDLPGHGESDRPAGLDYTMETHARAVKLLLGGKSFRHLHVIGHSMGGAIALILIKLRDNDCSGFINIEGNLISSDSTISRRAGHVSETKFIRTVLPNMLELMDRATDRGTRSWAEMVRRASPTAFYRSSRSLRNWSDSGRLLGMYRGLTCSRCYIYGQYSPVRPVLENLDKKETIMIPDSGHFPMIDNPEATWDAIGHFLAGFGTDIP